MSGLPGSLFALALRRTLSTGVVLALLIVLGLAWARDPLPGWTAPLDVDRVRRACLERQGMWSTYFFAMLPILVWRGAKLGEDWRLRDRIWLAGLPWTRGAMSLASALGPVAAAVLASALALLVISARIDGVPSPAPRLVHTFQNEGLLLPESREESRVWRVELLGGPSKLQAVQLTPSLVPGSGPAVELELALVAADGARTEERVRLFTRTPVRLSAPGPGPWTLELARREGAICFLPRSSVSGLEEAGPLGSDLGLFARCASGLVSWTLLALGLSAWMRLSLAVATCLSLSLVPWVFAEKAGVLLRAFPGSDLGPSLARLAEGIAPGPLPWVSWLTPLGLLAATTWMLRTSLVRGGRP